MICEHEIPTNSRLYFSKSAKLKREIEYKASHFFNQNGFEEIITPNFSYSQHQSIDDDTKLIKLQDEYNNTLALRADSTLDVVRIITKRLGRTTSHKKWFYIQPVFTYPSSEIYQIGAEWIGYNSISNIINLNCKLLDTLNIQATLQLANINIPLIISKEFDIDINIFKNGQIDVLYELDLPWLSSLIEATSINDLKNIQNNMPNCIKEEIKELLNIATDIEYDNLTLSPLYYSAMKYYDNTYYRIIKDNLTIAKGGSYKSEGLNSQGFAIYTDNIIKFYKNVV
jgi:ATP phosphoribosyltransferase regulatory subunit HisZ